MGLSTLLADLAEHHPLLSLSSDFADHSRFTKGERIRMFSITIITGWWSSVIAVAILTRVGIANGYPEPVCKIINFPSIPSNFSLSEFKQAWSLDFSGHELRDMDVIKVICMLTSFIVQTAVSLLCGPVLMQKIYEQDAYTYRRSQSLANLLYRAWFLSGLVYLALVWTRDLVIFDDNDPPTVCTSFADSCGIGYFSWSHGFTERSCLNSSKTQDVCLPELGQVLARDQLAGAGPSAAGRCWLTDMTESCDIGSAPPTAARDKHSRNVEEGCESAKYHVAAFVNPMYLLLFDLVLAGNIRYLLLRAIGVMKKPTSSWLKLERTSDSNLDSIRLVRNSKGEVVRQVKILTPTWVTRKGPNAKPYLRVELSMLNRKSKVLQDLVLHWRISKSHGDMAMVPPLHVPVRRSEYLMRSPKSGEPLTGLKIQPGEKATVAVLTMYCGRDVLEDVICNINFARSKKDVHGNLSVLEAEDSRDDYTPWVLRLEVAKANAPTDKKSIAGNTFGEFLMVVDEEHYFSQKALLGKAALDRAQLEKEGTERIKQMEKLEARRRKKLKAAREAWCYSCCTKNTATRLAKLLHDQHVYKGDHLPETSKVVVTVPGHHVVSQNPVHSSHANGSREIDVTMEEEEDWAEKASRAAVTVQAAHRGHRVRKRRAR